MTLAGTDGTGDDHIFSLLQVAAAGQFDYLLPVDSVKVIPLDLVQGPLVGEAGLPHQPGHLTLRQAQGRLWRTAWGFLASSDR